MLYACEWNPHAVEALRHNLHANSVADRCVVLEGDNRLTAPKVCMLHISLLIKVLHKLFILIYFMSIDIVSNNHLQLTGFPKILATLLQLSAGRLCSFEFKILEILVIHNAGMVGMPQEIKTQNNQKAPKEEYQGSSLDQIGVLYFIGVHVT